MTRIAAVGEAMIELALQGDAAQVGVAGDTLNTAIYLKRSAPDLTVDYVTALGDDPFSERIAGFIADQQIGTCAIRRIAGKSPGLYAITTTDTGERSFTYWRSAAAAREMFSTPNGFDFTVLDAYDVIYLSGITLAILPAGARHALLEWLATHDVTLAFDSNYRPRLWEDQATAREITQQFWERADICLPSIDDEMALFDETEEAVCCRFSNSGKSGALKRGERGAISLAEDVQQHYPPAAALIDTTAAGDSFNGAYLAALLSGATQGEALMAGHSCAARVVGFRGAIMPEV